MAYQYVNVYFDTNVLWTPAWPTPSAALERVAATASRLHGHVSLRIPDVVRRELKNLWTRSVLAEIQSTEARIDSLRKRVGATAQEIAIAGVDAGAILAQYDNAVASLYQTFITVPIPDISLSDMVDMAIQQDGLFEKEDKGFRDTVILHSIVTDLAGTHHKIGILLSNDNIFRTPYAAGLCQAHGVTLDVLDKISLASDRLDSYLTLQEKEQLEYERRHAETVLQWNLPGVNRSVAEFLIGRYFAQGEVVTVRTAAIQSIDAVTVPFPDDVRNWIRGRVTFIATIAVDLELRPLPTSGIEVDLDLWVQQTAVEHWSGTIKCEMDGVMPRTAGNFDPPDKAEAVRLLESHLVRAP